jgi:class 3 adenylate cyclase/cold shock CspA family protein
MFVDMVGSTELKENYSEATWINTFAFFYEKITKPVLDHRGEIVKFTGDGLMAAFEESIDAINAAIKIQEEISEAVRNRMIEVYASIGIATGRVVRFQTPGPNPSWDYIGTPVDCAARLCEIATAQAILVDEDTKSNAPLLRITSKFGQIKYRTPEDYVGEPQRVSLKGLRKPVTIYEILWSDQRYGLRRPVPPGEEILGRKEAMKAGTVIRWDPSAARAFIKSEEGEEFYSDSRYILEPNAVKVGARVWFIPRPNPYPSERKIAACLVVVGQEIKGTLKKIVDKNPEKIYGFVKIIDKTGTEASIYAPLGNNPLKFQTGDVISFTVSENPRGPIAVDIKPGT